MFLSAHENKKVAKPEIFSPQYWSHGFSLVERQILLKLEWNKLPIYSPEMILEIINTISPHSWKSMELNTLMVLQHPTCQG